MPVTAKKRRKKPKSTRAKRALRGKKAKAAAPIVPAVPLEELNVGDSPRDLMVDTPMESILSGGPPRETLGTVQPPAVRTSEDRVGSLLQQPLALPTGGTAWVRDIRWDANPDTGVATISVNMVVNDAGTTPIQPGDGHVIDNEGNLDAITFRPCATTTQVTSQYQIDTMAMNYLDTHGAAFRDDLIRCLSDNLTVELTSMAGDTGNAATWNNWCGRQRLLTSASSGTFTLTNTSTSGTGSTFGGLNYGGIFDDNVTAASNAAWYSPDWVNAEHSRAWGSGLAQRIRPHIERKMETPEERQAREEREVQVAAEREKRQAAQRKKDAQRRRELEEATERAKRLLKSMLTEEQVHDLETKKHFNLTVIDGKSGDEKIYRIDQGMAGNVKLLGPDGRPIRSYCIHAKTMDDEGRRLPNEDHMLAQKLLLECNEDEFLRIANMTRVG